MVCLEQYFGWPDQAYSALDVDVKEAGLASRNIPLNIYTTLCQRCSSLIVFTFQVWLIRSPVRSKVQASKIFVHGFAVYLVFHFRFVIAVKNEESFVDFHDHDCCYFLQTDREIIRSYACDISGCIFASWL